MTDRSGRLEAAEDPGVVAAPSTNGDGRATDQAALTRASHDGGLVRLIVLIVVIVALGAGAGYGAALLQPKQYAARAELRYSLSEALPNDLLREDRRLTTQLVMLRSRVVLAPVAFDNGETPEKLADNVSANIVDNSEIIEVEVRDGSRERAQALLSAVIDRYLIETNKDWRDPVFSYLESKVIELESQLKDVQDRLRAPGLTSQDSIALEQRQQVINDLLNPLRQELSTGEWGTRSAPPAEVLTAPYSVAAHVSPKPLLAAAAGGAAALVVAAFVVLLVAHRRLRS